MKVSNLIKVREAEAKDHKFLYNTWLKSYRNSFFALNMNNDVYYIQHKNLIKDIIEDDKTKIMLAVNKDDADEIYSYVVYSIFGNVKITHFVYTKYSFRKMGLINHLIKENDLFNDNINYITHIPRSYAHIKDKYNIEYSPYFITDIQIKNAIGGD